MPGMPGMNFGGPPPAKLTPEDVKNVFYGIGASVGKGVGDAFTPSKEEWQELLKGIDDAVAKKDPKVKVEEYQPKVRQLEGERREEKHAKALAENSEILAKLEKEPGIEKLPSGVLIKRTSPGTGEQPKPTDTVSVNYKGTTQDGKEFDSSFKRGKPADFPLNRVIKCWTDGVGAMKVGEKATLTCPSDLAYGQMPPPGSGIPANAILTFEVELLSIKAPPAPPDASAAAPVAGVTKPAEKKSGCAAIPAGFAPLALGLLALRRRR
jgi:FKBP-type peptidyl-prolyl cis-trans isomerase FkpA